MAGYSGTPLVQKIGIKPGFRVLLRNHPETFLKDLGPLPDGAETGNKFTVANAVICFTETLSDLKKAFPSLAAKLEPNGMLWISWPKKSSGVTTVLTFERVQRIGLNAGLVDVKICAIDDTWSGLKFVYRLKDRVKH